MPDLDATWLYGEIETKDGHRPVLNIFYATDSLRLSFDICKLASKVAIEYGLENDIQLNADPLKSHIALHLYEPGGLTNEHFAAAWEIAEAVRPSK
ncbi:MAG TPA: hypothetical protein VFT16_00585 [Candidatus Saccharimonadales bacterium]|nr:hypothetical protein [Candidatus Saccharimonadales bacterium]